MFGLAGTLTIVTGVMAAVWMMVRGVAAARSDDAAARVDVVTPAKVLFGASVVAFFVLEGAILADDFTVVYVANHHSVTTPFPFNVATGWAALEGSIVMWGAVLGGFTWMVARDNRTNRDRLSSGALVVMGFVALFFFGTMATIANPFETCIEAGTRSCITSSPIPLVGAEAPVDGAGPNALLQNHILMAVHPPLLYLGYVGLTVPFAYAMSALAIGLPGAEWLRRSKRWTSVAWSFLTLGIVLGSWWAYEVLSWGGYWAWDPVENASLMPWLVATAFLHSALVQERRGMLQAWNFVLVISAFALTILGTFLTRSGTVQSVHSFTQGPMGPALLGFLVVVLAGSFGLFAARANDVAQPSRLESLSSREGSFLLNNLLLTVYAAVVIVGTLYPIFLEAFTGDRVQVGPPFFNRLAVPLSFALLLAMGVGPIMPWRVAKPEVVWRRLHGPLQVALLAGAITVVTASTVGWVVLAVVAATFLISVVVRHAFVQAQQAAAKKGTGLGAELRRLFSADPGYWGGQLSHVGVALVTLGLAFAGNLAAHTEVTLEPGESVDFNGYTLTYDAPFSTSETNRNVVGATVEVMRDGESVTTLRPRLNQFNNASSLIATPAVHTTFGGDLYLTLRTVPEPGITLSLDSSPLMWTVWLGGLLTGIGGFVAGRGRRRRRRREIEVTAGV
jgi:cytochrome c-type biogenesis protein CcmF